MYWIWHPNTNRWALRFGDWKIVKYGKEDPKSPSVWNLYNLTDDPKEENNLATEYPEKVQELHKLFIKQRSLDLQSQ